MLCPLLAHLCLPSCSPGAVCWPSGDLVPSPKCKRGDSWLDFRINSLLSCAQELGAQALYGTSLPRAQILSPCWGHRVPRQGSGLAEGGAPLLRHYCTAYTRKRGVDMKPPPSCRLLCTVASHRCGVCYWTLVASSVFGFLPLHKLGKAEQ